MAEIRVPTLGESVTEATIGRWFKKEGEAVTVDEPLVELETDKVTIEVPAPAAGVLSDIAAKDGERSPSARFSARSRKAPAQPRRRKRRAGARPATPARQSRSRSSSSRSPPPPKRRRRRAARALGAHSPPKTARCRRPCRAPARTAASPKATCLPPSSAPRRSRAGRAARRRRAGARAVAPEMPRAKSACA